MFLGFTGAPSGTRRPNLIHYVHKIYLPAVFWFVALGIATHIKNRSSPSGCQNATAATLSCCGWRFVHPEGLEPPTTVPKTVMISTSPRVREMLVYHTFRTGNLQRISATINP